MVEVPAGPSRAGHVEGSDAPRSIVAVNHTLSSCGTAAFVFRGRELPVLR